MTAIQKKRHHYVPITYLERFCDSDGYLNVFRKGPCCERHRSKPSEIALRRYYYSQPLPDGGQNNNDLEDIFCQFETPWDTIYQLIRDKRPANAQIDQLFLFLGLQRVRVPAFRDAIEQSMAKFVREGLRYLDRIGELGPIPSELSGMDIVSEVLVKIDPHQSIHAMPILLQSVVGSHLDSFGYTVLHNETGIDFLTSDNPIAYFSSPRSSEDAIEPYVIHRDVPREFLFPIDPFTLLYGSSGDRQRFAKKGLKHTILRDAERAKRFNRISARFGYEALFARGSLPTAFLDKHAVFSPVLDPNFRGFDPDNMTMPPFIFGTRTKIPKWDKPRVVESTGTEKVD